MSPPAIPIRSAHPRTMRHVLDDLREAVGDYNDALTAKDEDAEDRATHYDRKRDDLWNELNRLSRRATGLGVEEWRAAFSEGII
jgi:hypothetical protein